MTKANKPKSLVDHDAENNLRHVGDKLAAALRRNSDYAVEIGKLKAHIAELEAKLAVPVKLPILWGGGKIINLCADSIRAAGFTVAGDDDES